MTWRVHGWDICLFNLSLNVGNGSGCLRQATSINNEYEISKSIIYNEYEISKSNIYFTNLKIVNLVLQLFQKEI